MRSEPGQGSGEPEDDPDPHEAAVQDEPDEGMESDPKEENRWQGVPEGPQCDQGPSLQQGARGDLRERVPPDPLDEPAAHEFLRDPLLAVREDPVQDRVRAPPLNVTRVRGALASPRRPAAAHHSPSPYARWTRSFTASKDGELDWTLTNRSARSTNEVTCAR